MKKTVGIVGLLILVALGWIAWPYYAVYDFANAIQQGDQVALERRVAWDSVRRGLREDFNGVLARSANIRSPRRPAPVRSPAAFSGLGKMGFNIVRFLTPHHS